MELEYCLFTTSIELIHVLIMLANIKKIDN